MPRPVTGAALLHLHRLFAEGSLAGLTDAQLLGRFAADRDEAAFAALVDRHGPMVLGVCRAVLGDAHVAEDAFQATFLTLARRSGVLRPAGESLGGYLHRVAHREARRLNAADARRRALDRRAAAEAARRGATADSDLIAAVHWAVADLPDRLRLPVVLCHLEGRTHAQAAAELLWGEATVRRRLADARDLLRSRLTREGIAPAVGVLALLRPDRPSAAASALRADRLARLAASSPAGPGLGAGLVAAATAWASRLARLASQGTVRVASVASLGAALCLIPGAPAPVGAPGASGPPLTGRVTLAGAPGAPEIPSPILRGEPQAPDDKDDEAEPMKRVTLTGRVERPDGMPAAGARVFVIEPDYQPIGPAPEPEAAARADADGRFTVQVPAPKAAEEAAEAAGQIPAHIIAMADGFGPAIAESPTEGEPPTLRLVPDDVPISGRILDIDGQPVPGATIRVQSLSRSPDEDLEEWLTTLEREQAAYAVQYRLLSGWPGRSVERLIGPATTDADGRFRLEGIGRERVVGLWIEAQTIETTVVFARTRPGELLRFPTFNPHDTEERHKASYYGNEFELVAGPTQVVVGSVRDADTGEPLAGAVVQSPSALGNPLGYIQTTTDAEGRYRLTGLSTGEDSLGNSNAVLVRPPDGEPYPMLLRDVQPGDPTAPVTIDFEMKRGAWIVGRVFNKVTGEGVSRAGLQYFIFEDNPHREDYRGFDYPRISFPLQSEEDGTFRIVGIPGRGLVGARSGNEGFRIGLGVDHLKAEDNGGFLRTVPSQCIPSSFNTMVEVDIPEGADTFPCEIPLDPGHWIEVRAVGPDGKPRTGVWAFGKADFYRLWRREPEGEETFDVTALGPDERRLILVAHEGDRLAGMAMAGGDGPDALAIEMQPWAEVTGRLVDPDGRPFASAALKPRDFVKAGADGSRVGSVPDELITLGDDGRFHIRGLLPGLTYTFWLDRDNRILGQPITELTVEAGEEKDLGDVVVEPPE
ncbi:sigma-70 family RNA polymerase sigma factor [Tautonia plasticadhaerens]|uniref:ECF RNA polymerase sigma factor SigE n=1 Tax=Tautonia plasticadhaerens TaxID=2527974 RepID=A0A518HEC5_9BACT|nr:sigma-70 family RNA polymerase sigma factor [Tautonia plasticadhaerens]QDV39199.1 ECF RNA polymerase sigma factor SigE [Tautonia plasticadhaerens]